MQKKERKAKRKINKVNLAAIIVSCVALFGLLIMCLGVGVIAYLLIDKPDLNVSDFETSESTIVLDRNDNQVFELGKVIRQNVEYDDLPESLIDAFVAVEDSRFFQHNGFDLPRFTKALLSNLKSLSFSQGGSTFTMQLVKNTYFTSDETSTGAARSGLSGLKRKAQEIVLAMELEKVQSKKEIFVNYLNKLYFGGTSQNIRGIAKASQYYFGKDVSELNLCESAFLAGVINLPNAYNPFLSIDNQNPKYLTWAQERRDEVLYLMNYHGYITDEEYKLAINTKMEDFLVDSTSSTGSGEGIAYQAYIDAVVDEVYDLTGLDPYTTPMIIHTCMDQDVQTLMDQIQAGEVDGYFEYPDEEFEVASLCLDNDTGEVIGILGGRNYAEGGALLLNHATNQKKQPGSSIKPVLVYSQAFEVLGWSTSHAVVDQPLAYEGTDLIISNSTGRYDGQVTLKYAVGMSLNTPAVTTIRELINSKGYTYLTDYMKSMGYDIDVQDFDEQYAIGGKGLEVTCEQMAGAYAALMNNGYYTTPHTVRKIEFLSDKPAVTPTYSSKQTISEQACFLTSELLKENVNGGYPNLMGLFRDDDYQVYAKTGTTNWDDSASVYGIPSGSIRDGWVVACTKDFTIATWMGYEKAQTGKPSYMDYTLYNKNIKGKISKLIIEKTVEKYGNPDDISKPSNISSITHIIGTFPYTAATISGLQDEYIVSGYIKTDSKYNYLASPQETTIEKLGVDPTVTLDGTSMTIEWPVYPDKTKLEVADEEMDISLKKSDGSTLLSATGQRLFDYTWVYGRVVYKATIEIDGKKLDTITSNDETKKLDISAYASPGSTVKTCAFYAYENGSSSDMRCVENKVSDDVTIEFSATDNYSTVKTYLQKQFKNANITLSAVALGTNDRVEGTISSIKIGSNSAVSVGSNGYNETIKNASTVTNIEIEYYENLSTIDVSLSRSDVTEGIKFTASVTGTVGNYSVSWSIVTPNNKTVTGTGETFIIPNNDSTNYPNGSYVITCTATDTKKSSTSTVTITK